MKLRATTRALMTMALVALALTIGLTVAPGRAHAEAQWYGAAAPSQSPVVDIAATPSGQGYWLVGSDGGVFAFGNAPFFGSLGGISLRSPITAIVATPSGQGYWLIATDGGVFSFGDATFLGSLGGLALSQPVIDAIATPTGAGYWMVASDGGVFAFGDAYFHGSTGGMTLRAPITAITSSPGGNGYWIVATDGGVFSFGDAPFRGSLGALTLQAPIVDASSTADGYWLVAGDGGVFSFGDAPFFGSAAAYGHLNAPMTSIVSNPSHNGYWTSALDGGVFGFDASSLIGRTGSVGHGPVGPSNPAILQRMGPLTITQPGAVIENVDVAGEIRVAAPNVTIRNFRANNVTQDSTGMVLEDGEIHGEQDGYADGIEWSNYTARRLDVHGVSDGFKAGTNTVIEDSWIHDLNFVNFGNGNWTHNDGVQLSSGRGVVIRGNTFERNRGNAAIFIDPDFGVIDDVLVEHNVLGGGGFTLYSVPSPKAPQFGVPSNVRIRNNVFIEEHLFDYATATPGSGWVWEGNTNTAGQPVSPRPW